MKKVLVLYAKSGFLGHKVISENITNLLKSSGYDATSGDLFEIDNQPEVRGGNSLYFWIIDKIPFVWRAIYLYWDFIPFLKYYRNNRLPLRFPNTTKLILETKPDILITCHNTATAVANYLKERKLYTNPLFTVFSDWHTQTFWVYKNVDKYFVVTPESKNDLVALGFKPEQVAVPGMMLAPEYYSPPSKSEARQRLGLSPDKTVILLMGGGRGWHIEKTLASLSKLTVPAEIIVIGGSDEKKAELEGFIITLPKHNITFKITGFVKSIDYFASADLLISKPGGLTSSQAFLLKLPLIAVSPLPGQEDENIKYLTRKKAILVPGGDIGGFVERLLKEPQRLRETAENAHKLAPVNAGQIILEQIRAG